MSDRSDTVCRKGIVTVMIDETLRLLVERAARVEIETGVKATRAITRRETFEELAGAVLTGEVPFDFYVGARPLRICIRGITIEPAFLANDQDLVVWAEIH